MPGLFITFEGGEGTGKTTQLQALSVHLRAGGWNALETRDPGGTPIGAEIRKLLLDREHAPMTATAELFLYEASRAQLVLESIRPALAQGCIVLCDRFTDSTVAYQGYGRGLDLEVISRLNDLAAGGLRPDLTFLLDLDPAVGLARTTQRMASQRRPTDRIEQELIGFHQRVREGYRAIAAAEPERVIVLDASRAVAETQEVLRRHMEDVLSPPRGCPGRTRSTPR